MPLAVLAAPSPSGKGYCTTMYDTIYTKECATSYSKNCHQNSKTKYRTEYDTKCETTSRKQCVPVPREVPDQV